MKSWKKRVSLELMRSMDIWQPVDQPKVVYHMTNRANVEKILQDGYIDTMTDYVCFFFPDLKSIPLYIELSCADEGRKYYDFDGKIHTAPPLIHEETVVLKLIPRYIEPMYWYKEVMSVKDHQITSDGELSADDIKKAREKIKQFDDCRICHYGNFKFKRDVEILELVDIDKMTFDLAET